MMNLTIQKIPSLDFNSKSFIKSAKIKALKIHKLKRSPKIVNNNFSIIFHYLDILHNYSTTNTIKKT